MFFSQKSLTSCPVSVIPSIMNKQSLVEILQSVVVILSLSKCIWLFKGNLSWAKLSLCTFIFIQSWFLFKECINSDAANIGGFSSQWYV